MTATVLTHPGYVNKIVEGVVYRTSIEQEHTVLGSAAEPIWWKMLTSTWYNTNTGDQKFQVRHWLQMDILETDIIEFEVSFRPGSAGPQPASVTVIGEDSFACELTINADDKRFWKANIEEGFYKCNSVATAGEFCTGNYIDGTASYSARAGNAENGDGISWATPYADDDEYDTWCKHAGSKDVWSPFECTEIVCPMWRDIVTLDVTNDLSFAEVKEGVNDTMNILVNRAMLYINDATNFATPARGPLEQKLEIGVFNNAAPMLATALMFKAMWSMLF